MICCLNPKCKKPQNPDGATVCENCASPLTPLLRGRYRPVQPIGQGGFGRTYLALDEDRLGTQCVVKQFSPQVQGTKSLEKAVRLFNQEAVRLDELGEHPQIPRLLAYFEQDNYLYLVQQFIEGQSLLQEMRQNGAFNERQIRDVLADLLPVLRFIHGHQVIHRDITPSNILRRKSDDRLVLIDFGVAKQIGESSPAETGTRIGTEGYAPIEQFRGGRAYPASDLYSLGATCLHLMTENRPDNLYDPLEGRWIWREYLMDRGTTVSDQFAHIMDSMLKDLVSERYQSSDEVMRDLNADYFIPSAPGAPSGIPKFRPPDLSRTRTQQTQRPAPRMAPPPPAMRSPSAPPAARPSRSPASAPPTSRPPNMWATVVQASGWRCLHTLVDHSSWVTSVAMAGSASLVASSSLDDSVKVWNPLKGELIFNLTGHTRDVNTVAISPDGKTLVSGSDDCTVKVWYLPTGALQRTCTGHARDVNAVAISPDGKLLISGGEDRTIRLWQLANGAPLRILPGVLSMIKTIATSPDGRSFASGGLDNKVRLWSLQTVEQQRLLSGHIQAINALAYSPDAQFLASASRDKTVKLWNLSTGSLVQNFADHTRDVNALAFAPDGKTLYSGSSDSTIKIWDVNTGKVIDTLMGHTDSVNAIALSNDGKVLVSGGSDNTVRVWTQG
ncbi:MULTISPECIES: serine/threonine-protein kinase [unclassified Leptolyngbya]|uniref:serine/threonine-protein kinase n=1 Tax=unclassified Leptolyngbya TaxID=2650499 RepID=UPI00168780CD|nr:MULTISPECIES: serine/threonine-protein kinase [unclassified Leptolyngbya]MBD1911016.1 serine/threonine protein kinase [Leptolyngbya sp. FACHB-8]MBD2158317.1 serine/threonine protein kinase [Leptolyngbya sp. FACHB-16]